MNNIFLIRHGQSESNAGILTEHPKTVNLTVLGRKQADRLRDILNQPPDLIVHSSYARAIQTALPTMQKYPEAKREEWRIEEFTYLCPSKYYRTTKVDRKPHSREYWKTLNPESRDGDGESFYDFFDRCMDCYRSLLNRKERIFIFTHGHVIRMMMWFFMVGLPNRGINAMKKYSTLRKGLYIPNASFVSMRLNGNPGMSPIHLSHLPPDLRSNTDKFPP